VGYDLMAVVEQRLRTPKDEKWRKTKVCKRKKGTFQLEEEKKLETII